MKKYFFNIVFPIIAMLLGSATAQAESMKWKGCGISKKAYVIALAKAFEEKMGIEVHLSGGGATKGIRETGKQTVDIGGSCRLYLRETSGDVVAEESNVTFVPVAWDALVVIAHKDIDVDDIALEQLKKILDGDIVNWGQLNGHSNSIKLFTRKGKISGVGHMFRKIVYHDAEHKFLGHSTAVKSSGVLERDIMKTPNSIGIDGISSAKKVDVKILSIDGIKPTKENIISGEYPLFRPLYLVINKKHSTDTAKAFIEFALSPQGQKIISEQGTVNLEEGKTLNNKWLAAGFDFI